MIAYGIGFVPEDRKTSGLALTMSGQQNITLPILRRMGWSLFGSGQFETDTASSAAHKAGVKGSLSARVAALSGGNQQKLLLARWLAAESSDFSSTSRLVASMSAPSRKSTLSFARSAPNAGPARYHLAREISELRGLCDRILVMCRGRLAREHAPTDSEANILAARLGIIRP